MSVNYSPQWLTENALLTLLQQQTPFSQSGSPLIFISDTLQTRKWPCLVIECKDNEQILVGRLPQSLGGYNSGVFRQQVEVRLETKRDALIQGTNADQLPVMSAEILMVILQAFFQNVLLSSLLTNAVAQPYECHSARITRVTPKVDEEMRLDITTINLELHVMANIG